MKKRSFLIMLITLVVLATVHSESLKITREEKTLDKVVIEYEATNGKTLKMFKYTNRTAKETFRTLVKLYGFPVAILTVDSDAIPFFKKEGYFCIPSEGHINFTVYDKTKNNVLMYVFSTSILEE